LRAYHPWVTPGAKNSAKVRRTPYISLHSSVLDKMIDRKPRKNGGWRLKGDGSQLTTPSPQERKALWNAVRTAIRPLLIAVAGRDDMFQEVPPRWERDLQKRGIFRESYSRIETSIGARS
jgi:hypothetical protein